MFMPAVLSSSPVRAQAGTDPSASGGGMTVLVVAFLALIGGTTWLALEQPMARHPVLHNRLTGAGLLLCLTAAVIALAAALLRMG